MGTNYYRVPPGHEMIKREQKLRMRIDEMDSINPYQIERGFCSISVGEWDSISPWEEFLEGTRVHLGKRISGWKFLWNWNDSQYYKTREELFEFIRSGRVIDEYGGIMEQEEFIQMALEWGQEDGWDIETYYKENPSHRISFIHNEKHEEYLDGLRVSTSTEFS
jgi:hypothetical protein